ncbi:MAG: aminopeptidase P family N-terminal domain-containing protein, partial [Kiritimatiellae bacterium]|nr:aminopeptidase P family N-terminal domain-containing protein [Kiritimatiellia bacterium]
MARKVKKAENAKKAELEKKAGGAPQRLVDFAEALRKKRVDAAVVRNEANVRALTGIECDNAMLLVYKSGEALFHTDFRYIPMVHRVAPWIDVKEIKKFSLARDIKAG